MAELFGLISGAAALAEITLVVFTNLYRYYGNVKHAPKASAELRNELGITLNVIDRLSGSLKKDTPSLQPYYKVLDAAVSELTLTLKDMEKRVTAEHTKGIN